MAKTRRPPTTPPAIAPVLIPFEAAGTEVLVVGAVVVAAGLGNSGVVVGAAVDDGDTTGVDGVGPPEATGIM